ncbi:uncharacterized protein E1O_12220 [Burkholderiales bacterium GJ-E10]|nr:uncharacterized protein E1O_12220 [Burkholderiales bacterium GJ-E10]
MLKTFVIDGDKGGVGKSLAARALVHYYLCLPEDDRPRIAVYDADLSNPDVCGEGGLKAGEGIMSTAMLDLSTEDGWIAFGDRISMLSAVARNSDVRLIVNMPAQIGTRAFDGSIHIVGEVLREANAIPVWMLSRTQESIRALDYRLRSLGARYTTGMVVKNLFFGAQDKFLLWDADMLRQTLVVEGSWLEAVLPELNDQLAVMIGRRPFHDVIKSGIDGVPLAFGFRLALNSWLQRAGAAMAQVEAIAAGEVC